MLKHLTVYLRRQASCVCGQASSFHAPYMIHGKAAFGTVRVRLSTVWSKGAHFCRQSGAVAEGTRVHQSWMIEPTVLLYLVEVASRVTHVGMAVLKYRRDSSSCCEICFIRTVLAGSLLAFGCLHLSHHTV